jgi:general secretion pathway protein G
MKNEANLKHGRRVRASSRLQAGMTLLEIMIVLAIIALVMGLLVGPRVLRSFQQAESETTRMLVKQFSDEAYVRWRANNPGQRCPESLSELTEYLNTSDTTDSWGNELVMRCGSNAPEGVTFGVLSPGPDGQEGTDDDITSW